MYVKYTAIRSILPKVFNKFKRDFWITKESNGVERKTYLKEKQQGGRHNKVTGWAVVCTILRPNNTWFTKTIITDMPDSVSEPLNQYLTETIEEPLVLTKEM